MIAHTATRFWQRCQMLVTNLQHGLQAARVTAEQPQINQDGYWLYRWDGGIKSCRDLGEAAAFRATQDSGMASIILAWFAGKN